MSIDPQEAKTIVAETNGKDGVGGAPWRTLIFAALLGAVGGGTVPLIQPEIVRPDPFKGSDADRLESKLHEDMTRLRKDLLLEVKAVKHLLCTRTPPSQVRRRIAELEGWVLQRSPDFKPGDLQWNDGSCGN